MKKTNVNISLNAIKLALRDLENAVEALETATTQSEHTIVWHDASQELPKRSMKVLVHTSDGVVIEVDYSKKWRAFNAADFLPNADHAFTDVTYWAEIPKPPVTEEVDDE